MLTGEVVTTIQDMTITTIQDINQIIVLIYVRWFFLPMKELLLFIKISINSD